MTDDTSRESAETLRERACWYREYAKICGGDNGWCLRLAAHFEAEAAARERPGEPAAGAR